MTDHDKQKRFEIVSLNPDQIEVLHRVLDLNEQILRQNAELIKELTNPRIIFDPQGKPTTTE